MITNFVKVSGHLVINVINSYGQLVENRECNNLVVNVGKKWIISRLKNSGDSYTVPDEMSHMAIGTQYHTGWPNSASSFDMLSLESNPEVARVALTSSNVTDNEITYEAVFDAGIGSGSIVEAGIFNGPIEGIMLCRTEFDVINKNLDDTMTVTWKIVLV